MHLKRPVKKHHATFIPLHKKNTANDDQKENSGHFESSQLIIDNTENTHAKLSHKNSIIREQIKSSVNNSLQKSCNKNADNECENINDKPQKNIAHVKEKKSLSKQSMKDRKNKLLTLNDAEKHQNKRNFANVEKKFGKNGCEKRLSGSNGILNTTKMLKSYGTWVECERCLKWRYLSEIAEPHLLPKTWFCELQEPLGKHSCSDCEDMDAQKKAEPLSIYNRFALGSIVWARLCGHPAWPAIIDIDPDYKSFFELEAETDDVASYHVTFLDKNVSRAWLNHDQIWPFHAFKEKINMDAAATTAKMSSKLMEAVSAAINAAQCCLAERIEKWSFEARYNGVENCWTKKNKKVKRKCRRKSASGLTEEKKNIDELHNVVSELTENNTSKAFQRGDGNLKGQVVKKKLIHKIATQEQKNTKFSLDNFALQTGNGNEYGAAKNGVRNFKTKGNLMVVNQKSPDIREKKSKQRSNKRCLSPNLSHKHVNLKKMKKDKHCKLVDEVPDADNICTPVYDSLPVED